ncbi:dTDP-4-dehydrorhamnose 3,5-epimerase [Amphritea sp. 1_MG-2023]|uniref:dTDP-4-dehydrorhamnose 3,5-epimerase n=1 Tax=Amphritea sp. 1_MG-2023 TaxID=3062670 RepID=UPI0026E26C3F|nr:dTDP-4-dehydrorhamnose 3,5-epimerase [Amphritea sp. 1_MG-2023]MDO6565136.1 dTDP-4-dehydrorhamnose 3,5-epimerase [Amphritea sp. 1_MG-2023]
MEFIKQHLPEVILIKPRVFGDVRGYFVETFRQDKFEEAVGYQVNFCQDNESNSSKGVLRGLHFQLPPYAQSKLVRVIEGKVLDVAVDIRVGSPTYGEYVTAELSAENKHQLFIPRGFAHAFVVLSDTAIFAYKVDNYYAPDHDRGLVFDDPDLNIDWQLPCDLLQLSEKDQKQPKLAELPICFEYGVNYYE